MKAKDLDDLSDRVGRAVTDLLAARKALPDPNMEPRPAVRAQLAEQRRVLSAYQSGIGVGWSGVLKVQGKYRQLVERRVCVVKAIEVLQTRAERATAESTRPSAVTARDEWRLAAQWLRGAVGGHEPPGGVIALADELSVALQPLPNIDADLLDLAARRDEKVAQLVADLDAWDRQRVVTGSLLAVTPAVVSRITATVQDH